jgi:hypothetical protein
MKNANHSLRQNRHRVPVRREYGSYKEYLEMFLPRPAEIAISDSEDPTEFGLQLAEVSLRKLEERLTRG